jgi:hypothetical protein
MTRFYLGEFVAAHTLLDRCMGLADLGHRTNEGPPFDPYALLLTYLAETLACLGYVDQARSRLDEALSESRRLGHAHTLAHVLVFANRIDWLTCSPDRHSKELLTLGPVSP